MSQLLGSDRTIIAPKLEKANLLFQGQQQTSLQSLNHLLANSTIKVEIKAVWIFGRALHDRGAYPTRYPESTSVSPSAQRIDLGQLLSGARGPAKALTTGIRVQRE